MKAAATSSILIALTLIGSDCVLGKKGAGARDRLCGWYKVTPENRLIPVFKIEGTFYTVMRRGFEIPLQNCPDGLELSRKVAGGLAGTKIGYDRQSGEFYLSLVDRNREYQDPSFTSGDKQPMIAIAKPAWLRDATAQPPRTNDDFRETR